MAAKVYQKHVSVELSTGSSVSGKVGAFVFNATSSAEALAAALAATSIFPTTLTVTTFAGASVTYVRDECHITELDIGAVGLTTGVAEPLVYDAEVDYVMLGVSNQPYTTGEGVTTFEIGVQQINVKQSLVTNGTYSASSYAPNFNRLINVEADGDVKGVEADVPTFTWSETWYVADASVTTTYIQAVYNVANNPINNDTFRDFAAYSVKFMGVSGTRRFKGGDWELNFKFSASPNATGLVVGDVTGIAKRGWDYLWVYQEKTTQTDAATKKWVQLHPAGVYVEKIYGDSNFAALGIGTS